MDELFAKNVHPQSVTGYHEIWYFGERKMHKGIQVPQKTIEYATYFPKFYGLQFGSKESNNFNWRPFLGAYHTEGYLIDSSVVVVNELKKKDSVGLKSFPKYVVSVLSQSKDGLKSTAQKLRLPLESLV